MFRHRSTSTGADAFVDDDRGALAATPRVPRPRSGATPAPGATRSRWAGLAGLLVEACALAALLTLYRWGRLLADGRHDLARRHADAVWNLEHLLHLPEELSLQRVLLEHTPLAHLANSYYAGVHFPLTGAALVWLYLRRRALYRWTRNTLVVMTGAGLLLAFCYPLAPPRMMPDLGFTDVAVRFGQSVYDGVTAGTSNQYAAMPSLHVGWAVLVGWALFTATRSPRLRWLWWSHPVTTVLVVVGTGNHFWLDGIVGAALFVAARSLVAPPRHHRRWGADTGRGTASWRQRPPGGAADPAADLRENLGPQGATLVGRCGPRRPTSGRRGWWPPARRGPRR